MNPRSFSDEGIVLTRRNYSEADRILSVCSKNHGRITLLAKGVRKPASRKRGHIEVFSRIKFQAVLGKGFDIITEAEIIDNFPAIRKNLKRVALAYYFMEVIGRITHEGEVNHELYLDILESLERLKKEKKLKSLRKDFIVNILTRLGFWPRGRVLPDPDSKLEEVIERNISAVRVGKRLLEV
jgi:DNA repair protein RecO (recombination protein O)